MRTDLQTSAKGRLKPQRGGLSLGQHPGVDLGEYASSGSPEGGALNTGPYRALTGLG